MEKYSEGIPIYNLIVIKMEITNREKKIASFLFLEMIKQFKFQSVLMKITKFTVANHTHSVQGTLNALEFIMIATKAHIIKSN